MAGRVLHVNQRFLLSEAAAAHPGGDVLDFGCGKGASLPFGRSLGLTVVGTDVADGCDDDAFVQCTSTSLPFPDGRFDAVVSNMVLEHVADLAAVVGELRRVVRPGGTLLLTCPTVETWWEGHCRVPFAHRIHGRRRRWWLKAWFAAGFGARASYDDADRFATRWAFYLDRWCFYRTRAELVAAFTAAGFTVAGAERRYVRFRWRLPVPVWVCRRALTSVFLLHAPAQSGGGVAGGAAPAAAPSLA